MSTLAYLVFGLSRLRIAKYFPDLLSRCSVISGFTPNSCTSLR